jgi:hypothetical protein
MKGNADAYTSQVESWGNHMSRGPLRRQGMSYVESNREWYRCDPSGEWVRSSSGTLNLSKGEAFPLRSRETRTVSYETRRE